MPTERMMWITRGGYIFGGGGWAKVILRPLQSGYVYWNTYDKFALKNWCAVL